MFRRFTIFFSGDVQKLPGELEQFQIFIQIKDSFGQFWTVFFLQYLQTFCVFRTMDHFTCKCTQLGSEQLVLRNKSSEVSIKTRSTLASLPYKGQVTEQTTVKWSIMLALMASFAMFPTVFKTYEKCYRRVCSKEVFKRHF